MVELDPPIMGSHGMTAVFFIGFVAVTIFVGWQVMTAANWGMAQLTKYCDGKYGVGNYTISNGHTCTGREDLESMFIGMHDCFDCSPKVNP